MDNHITFGSYNNLAKLTPEFIEAWSEIIKRVPGSKLRLKCKSFACSETKSNIISKFATHGLENSQLIFLPQTASVTDHLAEYRYIDIALDTFPYNGTTTTCEALWMGVPVVVLSGQRHASRVGSSILSRLGRGDWIATDRTNYKQIAVSLANNRDRLALERKKLRQDMQSSSLCDEAGFTTQIESVYRAVWKKWCVARKPVK